MKHKSLLTLLTVPLFAGCFTYVPVAPSAVSPDMAVRVRLTDDASRRMEATRDPETPIEGRVFEVSASQFGLLPEVGGGGSTEPVSLAFDDVRLLEHRQISQTKTWVMVGAGMAGGVLLLISIDAVPFASGRNGGGPGDFFISLPIGP